MDRVLSWFYCLYWLYWFHYCCRWMEYCVGFTVILIVLVSQLLQMDGALHLFYCCFVPTALVSLLPQMDTVEEKVQDTLIAQEKRRHHHRNKDRVSVLCWLFLWPLAQQRMGWLCCLCIVWKPIRKISSHTTHQGHSATVITAHWATVDWLCPENMELVCASWSPL